MASFYKADKDGLERLWYQDQEHPWPYYEGFSYNGASFSFLIPKSVTKEEKQQYAKELKWKRDVVSIEWVREETC